MSIANSRVAKKRRSPTSAVQLSSEWLTLAERNAKAGSWSWDIKTGLFHWSQGMFELFGLDATVDVPDFELWKRCIHPADREVAEKCVEQAMKQGSPLIFQYRIVRSDGEILWIDAYGDTVFDAHGAAERMSGFCMDSTLRITLENDKAALETQLSETRRLKEDLTKSNVQLEHALYVSGQGLWEYDVGSKHMTFDARACHLLGFQVGELDSPIETWRARVNPDDLRLMDSDMQAHLLGESDSFKTEFRFRHKNGRWIFLLCSGQEFISSGNQHAPKRLMGVLQDISRFKSATDDGALLVAQLETLLKRVTSPLQERGSSQDKLECDSLRKLSRRQREVIALIAKGMSSAEIAKKLNITTGTAVSHRRDLMKKLGLHNTAEVTRFALRHHLTDH
jgi:PAS domain S-box-containing protein